MLCAVLPMQPLCSQVQVQPLCSQMHPICSKMQPLCGKRQPLCSQMQPLCSHMQAKCSPYAAQCSPKHILWGQGQIREFRKKSRWTSAAELHFVSKSANFTRCFLRVMLRLYQFLHGPETLRPSIPAYIWSPPWAIYWPSACTLCVIVMYTIPLPCGT
jgi:hypothetical protein